MHMHEMLELASHGPDTYIGSGPQYPWGGLYGGQIVAQALRAAAFTVPDELEVHSLRAYFIRKGDHNETVRYEIDRIRNGRSFATRRVVARQATGAILNLEASFQAAEASEDVQTISLDPGLPTWEDLEQTSWSPAFQRAFVPNSARSHPSIEGASRAAAWIKVSEPLDDASIVHRAALAYVSDDLPTDAVVRAHPAGLLPPEELMKVIFTASLDHTIWFHRPMRADEWHLHDFACHGFVGGRGLAIGHVFDANGTHTATVAQEVLMRDLRDR